MSCDSLQALYELLLLLIAIVATIYSFYPINNTAAYLLLPYLTWITFACFLILATWRLNTDKMNKKNRKKEK